MAMGFGPYDDELAKRYLFISGSMIYRSYYLFIQMFYSFIVNHYISLALSRSLPNEFDSGSYDYGWVDK